MSEFKPQLTAENKKTVEKISVENIKARINNLEEKAVRDPKATKILEDYKTAHMKLVESMLPKKKSLTESKVTEESPFDRDAESAKLAAAAARSAARQPGQNIQPGR